MFVEFAVASKDTDFARLNTFSGSVLVTCSHTVEILLQYLPFLCSRGRTGRKFQILWKKQLQKFGKCAKNHAFLTNNNRSYYSSGTTKQLPITTGETPRSYFADADDKVAASRKNFQSFS